ncbi:tetratricopeptide repeat protein [Geobacter hydrogenophilus]|uniref:Lipoprotein n=2 Tax=Geobacter hydrogenophilus TaxID=40983 RepID=A0A9W6G2I1_9BACT|nr:tetratricopeptide repeat protein [Geobacter hydrogenophilus]GLI39217.1 lipoprotein [Geobacter hydrogenophilus]
MTSRMIIIILVTACLSACTTVQKSLEGQRLRSAQQDKLEQAVKFIERGNSEKAEVLLEEVVAAPGVRGITDEALFRLALLSMPSDLDREDLANAVKYLDRLQKEYPVSPWATQSSSLTDLLAVLPRHLQSTTELRRQIKSLRDLNLSLTRENKEMRLNIEKIKNLDLQLEKKVKP